METFGDHPPTSPDPDEEEFRVLIEDLRKLPKLDAPPNFDAALETRIAREREPRGTTSRLFAGLFDRVQRIPALAYGLGAFLVVVAFSIYVYYASDLGQQLHRVPSIDRAARPDTGLPTEATSTEQPAREKDAGTSNQKGARQYRPATPPHSETPAEKFEAPVQGEEQRTDNNVLKKAGKDAGAANTPTEEQQALDDALPATRGVTNELSRSTRTLDSLSAARDSIQRANRQRPAKPSEPVKDKRSR
jgi:hypothetical protein